MEAVPFGRSLTTFAHFLHQPLQHIKQGKYPSSLMRQVWLAGEDSVAVVANAQAVEALAGFAE